MTGTEALRWCMNNGVRINFKKDGTILLIYHSFGELYIQQPGHYMKLPETVETLKGKVARQ